MGQQVGFSFYVYGTVRAGPGEERKGVKGLLTVLETLAQPLAEQLAGAGEVMPLNGLRLTGALEEQDTGRIDGVGVLQVVEVAATPDLNADPLLRLAAAALGEIWQEAGAEDYLQFMIVTQEGDKLLVSINSNTKGLPVDQALPKPQPPDPLPVSGPNER